jgi:hypothetical protein
MWPLYRDEQEQELERVKVLARMTAIETARLLAPMWGYELKEAQGVERSPVEHEHNFIDGKCQGCDLRNTNGVLHHGPLPVECDEHVFVGDVCKRCGGKNMGTWVTSASPRIIGQCEHMRHVPNAGGGLRCLDCGNVGY